MPRIYRPSDGMSVNCRAGYLVLFGTTRFSESGSDDYDFVTTATGIVNTLFGDVHRISNSASVRKNGGLI
jgi:hypothetical protein